MSKSPRPDLWVIAPPKKHDIKYLDNRDYRLEYIYTDDACINVEIMELRCRTIGPLIKRVEQLRRQARSQIKKGQRVTNWIFRGEEL